MTTMQDAERIREAVSEMAREIEDGRAEYQEAMHALGQAGVPWATDEACHQVEDVRGPKQLALVERIRRMAKRWNEAERSRGSLITELAQTKATLGLVMDERDGVEEAMQHVREELGCKEGDSVLDAARAMVGICKEVAEAVRPVMTSDRDVLLAVKSLVREVGALRAKESTDLGRMLRDSRFSQDRDSWGEFDLRDLTDEELMTKALNRLDESNDLASELGLLRGTLSRFDGTVEGAVAHGAAHAREEWQRERATLVAQLQLVREALHIQEGEDVVEVARQTQRGSGPTDYIDIVFDGPPSHESGRFVEVEDRDGKSIKVGEWIEDKGSATFGVPVPLWRLRIPRTTQEANRVTLASHGLTQATTARNALLAGVGVPEDEWSGLDLASAVARALEDRERLSSEGWTALAASEKRCSELQAEVKGLNDLWSEDRSRLIGEASDSVNALLKRVVELEGALGAWKNASTMSGGGSGGSTLTRNMALANEASQIAASWRACSLPAPERVVELTRKARPLTDQEIQDLKCPTAEQGRSWYVVGDALFLGHAVTPDVIPPGVFFESALARMRSIYCRNAMIVDGVIMQQDALDALRRVDGAIAHLSSHLTKPWPIPRYAVSTIEKLVDHRHSILAIDEQQSMQRNDLFRRSDLEIELGSKTVAVEVERTK